MDDERYVKSIEGPHGPHTNTFFVIVLVFKPASHRLKTDGRVKHALSFQYSELLFFSSESDSIFLRRKNCNKDSHIIRRSVMKGRAET